MSVQVTAGASRVTVDEVIAVTMIRPLRRTADDAIGQADYLVTSGTPGRRKGTITYLCPDEATTAALEALYQGTATLVLTTGAGNPLNGLRHVAVGDLRIATERALPGRLPRWTVQAEVREMP